MDKVKNIIYKAKNKQRKCFYVGYSCRGLESRKHNHKSDCFKKHSKTKFYEFIRKYSWDSFTWEVLAVYSTKEELPQAEIDWLKQQKEEFSDWECLNLTNGGEGNFGWSPSKEQKENMSKNHADVSGEKNPMFGTMGSFYGKKHTEETKQKQSLSNPKYWLGKTFSKETKDKMSNSRKGRIPWNKGIKYSQKKKQQVVI